MISPILELYKGKLYLIFSSFFIKDCINNLGTNIFSQKKSLIRTLTNLLSSWMFNLYSFNNLSNINYNILFNTTPTIKTIPNDIFLPNNYNDTYILKITLLDFCKYKKDENINYEEIIDKLLLEFIYFYEKQIIILNTYKNSKFYLTQKNNYKVHKK